ncbi:dmX-like protein 2 [Petromyzon marinus]|uniref:dmX-like protein 2 n=1 Tax=Petromyzon marinus TaxID=7757 RepID=UPI003F720776
MKLHQVLTGAVNPGENTFSVGLLDGAAFTAYASGCDIVILGSNFERVQIIPGSKHGNIQVGCLSCSARLGKIAASYGDTVSIFEPFPLVNKASNPLGLQWHKTGQLKVPSAVLDLAWDPQADSLLTASSSLQLWSCSPGSEVAVDSPASESALTGCVWAAVWTCRTALPVTQIKFSPDGYFFATTGKNDCLVKVWYRTDGWHACRVVGVSGGGSCTDPAVMPTERPAFSFAYLAHPRAVTSLSWRKTSTYLPRGAACNTLLTSCRDGICRVWLETVLPEDCLQECPAVSGHGARGEPPPSVRLAAAAGPRGKAQRERMHHMLGSFQQLKMLKRRKRTLQRDGLGSVLAEALPGSPALPRQPRILAHFHIAASINPKTDIPLMPAMGCPGVDGDGPPFVVHWLNNKYLQFTLSLECLLQQLQPPAPPGGSRGGSGRAADAGSQEEAGGEVGGRDAPDGNSDNHSSSRESEDGICSLDDGSEKESDTPTGTAPRRPPGISTTTNTTLTAAAAVAASTPTDGSGPLGGTGRPKHAGAAGAAWQVENGLDWLVRDWQSAPDMLYSVHALDGSFLVWHVDWLDESQPGVFKQVQVCFSSRIPVAFPAGDAHSMGKHMYLYACSSGARHAGDPAAGTSPHHPRYYSSSSSFSSVPRSSSGHLISSSLGRNLGSCGSIGSIGGGMGGPFGALLVPPSVKLVTKHADGSLNQWAVCFGEDAAFRTVLGISHQSRYCGHRFRLTGQACHAVLPLLLTTAHHAPRDDAPPDGRSSPRPSPADDVALKRPGSRFVRREAGGSSGGSSGGSPGDAFAGPAMMRRSRRGEGGGGGGGACGPPGRQLRRLMSDCDVLAVRSELILWRVDPVGPLSHTGGVLELARINCASEDAFSHMAWLPTTVPGYCLGTYCNSPSSCFVASDGWNLRLYQAVIDARKLLDELSKPQLSRLVGDVFSIVSQQSTARPGCIIELDVITEQCPSSTQFLHVFSEELILGRRSKDTEEGDGSNLASGAGPGRAPQFSEKFFLVSIERAEGGQSLLKMWSLHLTSVQALAAETQAWQNSPGTPQSSGTGTGSGASSSSSTSSSAESRPPFGGGGGSGGSTTLPRTASSANLQTASRLTLASRLLHSQPLPLQHGVEIIHATPAAGHLSSSSIYPVCLAPYLIATSCSDGTVRFWRCSVADAKASQQQQQQPGSNGPQDASYSWEEWPLQCDEAAPSAISVPGRPVAVSCSYPGCVAVAYRREEHNASSARDSSLYVSVFECESSGGSSWLLEETLPLGGVGRRLHPHHAVDSNLMVYSHPPGGDGAASSVHHRHPHGPTERALLRHHHDHAKHLLHIDWVSKEDGSHMLTVAVGARVVIYGRLSWTAGEPASRGGAPAASSHGALPASYRPAKTRWVPLRCVGLVSAFDGSPALPVELSWVRDGVLVAGMDCEMHVYSQWQDPTAAASVADEQALLLLTREFDKISSSRAPRHSASAGNVRQAAQFGGAKKQPLPQGPSRKSLSKCPTALRPLLHEQNPALVLPEAVRGCGLFEAAEVLSPTLAQYHPLQLSGLLDLGRVRQVRAVLAHLVRCVAGDLAYVAEAGAELSTRERKHSRAGSTSSGMLAGREEAGDYPQIDAVPPLPLFSLLAADGAGSMGPTQHNPGQVPEKDGRRVGGSADTDQYGDLFEVPSLATVDDLDATVDGETEGDELAGANRVVDLSRFGATYFGPEQAQVLAGHLVQASLPGLSRLEQMHLMALADTVATTASQGSMESVDACGLRFLLAVRLHSFLLSSLPPLHRAQLQHQGLSTCHFAWAFHSTSQEDLLGMLPAMQRADGPTWAELRAMGVGWWLRGRAALRLCMEKLAKVAFQRNNDPLDAALYYLAMGKKGVLWGLFRSKGDSKMTQFFSNNFGEERWRRAALKNAFALLGKRRFEQAAAFFLLAGALRDAIEVCLEKLNDIQLALVVARLQESNTDAPATYRSILGCRVLGRNELSGADAAATPELAELTRACELRKDRDPFLRSIACWVKSDYPGALDALLEQPDSACDADEDGGSGGSDGSGGSGGSGGGSASPGLCSPGVFNFYNFLRGHPLIVRHHMLSHGGAGQRPADTISLRERRLFFATASTHLKSGCPLLALDVLRRMPHAEKEVVTVTSARGGGRLPLENGHVHGGSSVWGTAGAHPSSGHHTAESADWASSAMTVADEPLELSWDSEEDEEEEDEEDDDDEDQGITMKKTRAFKKGTADVAESDVEKRPESLPPAPLGTDGYVDVMAEQMKFRACLKLLVDELRTLATGYEVDRGKLHVQLCHWLEREVATLQEVCGYPGDLHGTATGSLDTVAEDTESKLSGATDACPFIGGGGSGGVTPDDTEAWREQHSLHARQLHAARRRRWLCANLPLLHMFLGYCSLHGAQGGGLASVRVELLFLIQESQQEAVLKQLHSRLPLPTMLPLISASLATLKTVISNPVLHVANLAHDILRTVSDMPTPPEPPKDNPQVHMIYVLAASLSACVYQSLCDSHSFSSEAASCPFTGLSYKSCLLRDRLRQRHESTSNLQSTSLPSQWPGVTQLLSQLHACRDEEQPPLRMLLCEALLAVFLGMLGRALATNAAGRLYRLSARPLDARSWASLFGGAARVPQCATPSPAQTLPPPQQQQQAPSSSSSKGNSTGEAVKTQQGSTRNRAQQQSETSSSGGRIRADEASKHRHRLNMRILVTSPSPPSTATPTQRAVVSTVSGSSGGGGGAGGSVELGGSWAQSPLTPCANFREVFVPPELSIWDYYMAKPFVASDDGLGYDSDESEESEEEEEEEEDGGDEEADYDPILDKDDERVTRRRSREHEHSDPNSYSWCLMRLVVVRLAITNMRGFFPMAGLEMSDLPSCSPLCHMALCTLSQWEQALCARLEATPGPPDDYIPTLGAHTGDGPAGPAILRYKAMLEPGNTPFSSHRRSALAAKRLWQFLVRHESMQETFIRHIFTRAHHRHQQQQQEEESSSSGNLNYVTEDHGSNRTELSAGSPITRARIVHKETDIITAFAINRANPSCLAAASAHEVLELDLSSILSSSCQAWVEEESESEGSSNEDFLVVYTKDDAFRSSSIGSFHTNSPYTPSSTGTTSSIGGQTGRGPTMLLRRNLSNVRRMASHPILPYYVTGGQDGSVRVFEWGHAEQLQVMRPPPAPRVTRLRFCAQSNRKFGVTDGDGFLSLWQLDLTNKNPKPYLTLKCHSRDTFDFTFLGSSSVVATAGQSSDGRNVRLWDTLVPHRSSLVHGFPCLEAGATVLGYAPRSQTLIVGGRKGHVTLLDLRQRVARHTVQAHESAVKAIAVHPGEGFFLTGSAEGNIKVWSLPAPTLISTYANEHARQSIFRHLGAGVMQIETGPGRHVFSCGADGTIKTRVLLQHSGGW